MTHHTDAELLPCPFCGCKDILVKARKTTMVECKDCGSVMFDYQDGVPRSAIDAWNRRAPAAPVPQPDALRNAAQSALDLLEYVKKAPSDAGFIDWRAAEVEKELRAALSGDAAAPQPFRARR